MKILIVMYSINVFLTFTLSQLGMVRHWWEVRAAQPHWKRRFLLSRCSAPRSPAASWS